VIVPVLLPVFTGIISVVLPALLPFTSTLLSIPLPFSTPLLSIPLPFSTPLLPVSAIGVVASLLPRLAVLGRILAARLAGRVTRLLPILHLTGASTCLLPVLHLTGASACLLPVLHLTGASACLLPVLHRLAARLTSRAPLQAPAAGNPTAGIISGGATASTARSPSPAERAAIRDPTGR